MERYELEHEELLNRFYGDCKGMIRRLEESGDGWLRDLYGSLEDGGEYSESDFGAGLLEYEGGVNICRIFLPKPERPALCAVIYLIYSREYEPLNFLTVEASPEGGYMLLSWDAGGVYRPRGEYDGTKERALIDEVVRETLDAEEPESNSRYGEMRELLTRLEIPFYDNDVVDYIRMFDVIGELCQNAVDTPAIAAGFAALKDVMEDDSVETSRARMMKMFDMLEELPETKGRLDRKGKLFFAFSVYAACSLISENDDKKHYYMGIPEFESADYIKYKMEEYWSLDPYMFSFAVR